MSLAALPSEARDGGPDLEPLRETLTRRGILIAARRIRTGDEASFPDQPAAAGLSLARRRASGAARIAASQLLADHGADASTLLPRTPSGAPLWPDGIVGSLAHDEAFAIAAAARRAHVVGLGVDIEPAEALPGDLLDFVLGAEERRRTRGDGVARRLVFACKEAVYKAIHPFDGTPLDYGDIEIDLDEGAATLRDGRRLRLAVHRGGRLVAVAWAPARSAGLASHSNDFRRF